MKLDKCFSYYTTLVLVLLLSFSNRGLCGDGSWSAETTDLAFSVGTPENPGKRNLIIPSPDRRSRIVGSGYELHVEAYGEQVDKPDEGSLPFYGLAELGWASDSRAFFITQCDGGAVGTWDVGAYVLTPSGLRKAAITDAAKKDFMKRYNCKVPDDRTANEIPNMAGIAWLNGSKQLLLLAEVPPHSSCPAMGKFLGYVVSVPSGKIIARYSAREMKDRWGQSLGPRHSQDEQYGTEKDRLYQWRK